jgi:hypothetical protein
MGKTALDTLGWVLSNLPSFLVAIAILWVGKTIYAWTLRSVNFSEVLGKKDNPGFGVLLAGYLAGLAIAISGIAAGGGTDAMEHFVNVACYGIYAAVLMRVSVHLFDKFVLNKFEIYKEIIEDHNLGVGITMAASCVATGLMINGVLHGTTMIDLSAMGTVAIYWAIGQVLLMLTAKIFMHAVGFDMQAFLEQNEGSDFNQKRATSTGLVFAGFLLAIGFVSRVAFNGASDDIAAEGVTAAILALSCSVIMIATIRLCSRAFLSTGSIANEVSNDGNMAAGALAMGSFFSIALLLCSVVDLSSGNRLVSQTSVDEKAIQESVKSAVVKEFGDRALKVDSVKVGTVESKGDVTPPAVNEPQVK